MLYGFHPVIEALIARRRTIYQVMVDRRNLSDRQTQLAEMAEQHQIPLKILTVQQLRTTCGTDQHQGVAAMVSALPMDDLGAIVDRADPEQGPCLLMVLDSIKDPNNLGAIVRSAHCAGANALVIPKDRAARVTPAVSKASAGALEHSRLCRVTNLASSIQWLKKQGVWVAGLAMQAKHSVFEADLKGPLALVVGGEEKGLRPLVRQHCDYLISIPLRGRIESLNASAAATVVLYEAFRQRHGAG
jgi:23S rRNA (guanosine2251-2'-O)-methyltransferase